MLNVITAKFCSGSTQTWTDEAWQYDYGQVLQFDGLELPEAYQVHFSNTPMSGNTITQIGGADGVTVPDQYFQSGETVYAWVYLHEGEDDGETVYMVTIPVKKRPQPSDDVPTPVEQSAIDQAIAALNIAVEKAEDAIEHYPQIIDGTWHVWDVTAEEYVDTGVEAQGEQGQPGTDGTDGTDGQDGFSPVITVTDITGGHRVTITDAEGTQTVDMMNGQPGTPGTAGTDGYSPTVTVTEITGGHRVTITDAQGSHVFDVMDGSDASVTVDSELSTTSENPVQNKIITGAVNQLNEDLSQLQDDIFYVTPEQFGAVGDGVTDDSQAVQDAVDAGYAVYFSSGKTYYIPSTVTIDHDCHLFGGKNAVIKTATASRESLNDVFVVSGTLKDTTTLTTNYTTLGDTDNSGDRFTLIDMSNVGIGDIMVITATDQYYSYARQYYYLGATLQVGDMYGGHIYATDSMPYDIVNTANVTVEIYDAPTAIFENLSFVADQDSRGHYKYFIKLNHVKNSVVRNCTMTEMDNGLIVSQSVNTLIEDCSVSKAKYSNDLGGDGYGIVIDSSSNTAIRRIMSICAQSCIDMGGTLPSINTWIKECNLTAECRASGFGMHENAYNTVIEDCVLGGATLYGTVIVNRCHIINSRRHGGYYNGITFRGNHDKRFASIKISNCTFDYGNVYLRKPAVQNPVQSFDNIIDYVEIDNCTGGWVTYDATADVTVLTNTINRITIKNWNDCRYIQNLSDGIIKQIEIYNTTFTSTIWINDGSVLSYEGVSFIKVKNDYPQIERVYGNLTKNGAKYYLPKGVSINFSSNDTNGHYTVCGKNIASNVPSDYSVGSVSGTVGSTLTRTVNSAFNDSVSIDDNGTLVFTQPNNTTANTFIYPKCLFYVDELSTIDYSCIVKNTGETTGAKFTPYICTIDADTGLITYISYGTAQIATAEGISISFSRSVSANTLVSCYLLCQNPPQGCKTTLEEFTIKSTPSGFINVGYEPYNGSSCTGNGTLKSVDGINYVMATPDTFKASFKADFLDTLAVIPCTGITFATNAINIADYNPVTVSYTVHPSTTTELITWTSSDTSVATVSNGTIIAVGSGTCTVTATCGSYSASATVEVNLSYIENYAWLYPAVSSNHVNWSANYRRIATLGSGTQAGTYGLYNASLGYVYPILLPSNTTMVKLTCDPTKTSMLYNATTNVEYYWLKNEPSGDSGLTQAAKYISNGDGDLRDAEETYAVPSGADLFFAVIRFATEYPSTDNPATVAGTLGLEVEFLKAL